MSREWADIGRTPLICALRTGLEVPPRGLLAKIAARPGRRVKPGEEGGNGVHRAPPPRVSRPSGGRSRSAEPGPSGRLFLRGSERRQREADRPRPRPRPVPWAPDRRRASAACPGNASANGSAGLPGEEGGNGGHTERPSPRVPAKRRRSRRAEPGPSARLFSDALSGGGEKPTARARPAPGPLGPESAPRPRGLSGERSANGATGLPGNAGRARQTTPRYRPRPPCRVAAMETKPVAAGESGEPRRQAVATSTAGTLSISVRASILSPSSDQGR